jgi:hypothetical protein
MANAQGAVGRCGGRRKRGYARISFKKKFLIASLLIEISMMNERGMVSSVSDFVAVQDDAARMIEKFYRY